MQANLSVLALLQMPLAGGRIVHAMTHAAAKAAAAAGTVAILSGTPESEAAVKAMNLHALSTLHVSGPVQTDRPALHATALA